MAAGLLLIGATDIVRISHSNGFRRHSTPVDLTPGTDPQMWQFLWLARDVVPPGTAYTVAAPSPSEEQDLYMLSVGLFPKDRPYPHFYYGSEHGRPDEHPLYVLSYHRTLDDPDLTPVMRCDLGTVYRRR
ncbi:MAG: hypothetical protein WBX15_10395 [Thermoanaerobaculia bacterium]